MRTIRLIWPVAAALAALLGAAVISVPPAYAGSMAFEVEGSIGGDMTNDQLSSGSSKLDLSQTGLAAGVGAALVWENNRIIAGMLGRYTYMHETGDVLSASIASHNIIEAAAKFGVRMTQATSIYALGGWAWKDVDLASIKMGTKYVNGPLVGGGIEHQIAKSNWFVRAEYEHYFFSDIALGTSAKATPDDNLVRLGVAYRFNATQAPDVFSASGLPAESAGCDPKMGNCPPLK